MRDLNEFLNNFSKSNKTENQVFEICEISKEIINFDFEKFKFSLDFYAIRHILNRHGNDEIEKLLGQKAVNLDDFLLIERIFNDPDTCYFDGKNNSNKIVFAFEKQFDTFYKIIVELRTGRKQLALNTKRKIKKNRQL